MGWRVASGRAVVTRRTVEEANEAAASADRELETRRERRDTALDATRDRARHAATRRRPRSCPDPRRRRATHAEEARLSAEVETLTTTERRRSRAISRTRRADRHGRRRAARACVSNCPGSKRPGARVWRAKSAWRRERGAWTLCVVRVDEEATVLSRREAEFAERRRLIEQRQARNRHRLEGRSGERGSSRQASAPGVRPPGAGATPELVERAAEEIRVDPRGDGLDVSRTT